MTKMSPTRLISLLAVAGQIIPATALVGASDPDLVNLLVQNGVLTSEQASALDTRDGATTDPQLLDALVASGAISAGQRANLASRSSSEATPSDTASTRSPVVKPKEKVVDSLTLSGRIHLQGDFLQTDYAGASDPSDEKNLFLRRVYLGASADFTDRISGTLNANFGTDASGTAELEKAVIAYELSDEWTLAGGFQKAPFGFEETTSSSRLLTVERSIATRYFTEQIDYGGRFAGLFLDGDYDSGFYFSAAITNSDQGKVSSSSTNNELALWGRAGWKGEVGAGQLKIGVNGGRLEDQRVNGSTDFIWSAYANYKVSDFDFTFEYLGGTLEDTSGGSDANPVGLYLTGAWQLNPSFQLVGRVSTFDADGGVGADISDTFRRAPENGSALYDEAQAYYIGANWYITGNSLKLSAGYEFVEYEKNLTGQQGDAEADGFRTRLQLLF